MKFEVGKKYKRLRSEHLNIYQVLYIGMWKALVRTENGFETAIPLGDSTLYTEYHEPKVEKFTKFVRRYESDPPHTSDTIFSVDSPKILGKIELTLTDGKLTAVKLLEE